MNRFRSLVPALVVMTLIAIAALARPGNTANSRPSAALPVGYVDMDEVAAKSVVGQNTKKQATELKNKIQDDLEKKQQIAYLTAAQRDELEKLQAKTSTTDAEKARIAELQGTTAKIDKELLELSQKTSPTAAETARIKELTDQRAKGIEKFTSDRDAAQQELDNQALELVTGLQDKITKAVEDVARERGLAMVVHKEARIFGGEDITEAVIGRLKK
jgi:Skp family chaperone for outer membrane proteins